MERAIPPESSPMECTLGPWRSSRKPPCTWTCPAWRPNGQRNENNTRDSVPLSSNWSGWQRGGLHESGHSIRARNTSTVRCAAGGNASGPGSMHTIRSRSPAISAAANAIRSPFAVAAFAEGHTAVYHRIAVFQRDHWECAYCADTRRYVPNGEIHGKWKMMRLSERVDVQRRFSFFCTPNGHAETTDENECNSVSILFQTT